MYEHVFFLFFSWVTGLYLLTYYLHNYSTVRTHFLIAIIIFFLKSHVSFSLMIDCIPLKMCGYETQAVINRENLSLWILYIKCLYIAISKGCYFGWNCFSNLFNGDFICCRKTSHFTRWSWLDRIPCLMESLMSASTYSGIIISNGTWGIPISWKKHKVV